MSGVVKMVKAANLRPAGSVEVGDSLSVKQAHSKVANGVEEKIVDRLTSLENLALQAIEDRDCDRRLAHSDQSVEQLTSASKILLELVEPDGQRSVEEQLTHLLECLKAISKSKSNERLAHRKYVAWMQLYSMLPIYLRQHPSDLETALDESIFIAYQTLALIDLDRELGSELFELLSEPQHLDHFPNLAIQDSLHFDLLKVVETFAVRTSRSKELHSATIAQRLSTDRSEGYWSIVQQWTAGAAHVRIPTKLSVGKVLWPKVRDHWTRFSQSLLDELKLSDSTSKADELMVDDSSNPSGPSSLTADFVEIRNANDPQLAKTLDIQLERCRNEDGAISLAVIQVLGPSDTLVKGTTRHALTPWQAMVIDRLRVATDGRTTRGFISEVGELALMIDDLDRNEVTSIIRETIEIVSQPPDHGSSMIEVPRIPLVCGVACVSSPSKRLQFDQLIQSAWRCLDAAKLQGPGSVKSIEVF